MRLCLSTLLFLFLMFAGVVGPGVANSQSEPPTLTAGKLIEREIAAGETHLYQIALPDRQYVFARVEQFTIDVKVRILRPDGQALAEFHHPGGTDDAETVMFIAEAAGAYRFEITPAAREALRGKYGVHIKESRPATPPDETRIRAEKLYLDGMWGFGGDAASKQRALEMLQQAAAFWHELNDPQGEGRAFNMLGLFSGLMGQRQQARSYYQQAMSLARDAGDRQRQIEVLNMLGAFARDDGELRLARDLLEQAATLAREMGKKQSEIQVLVQQGWLSFLLWEDGQALDFFETARQLGQGISDPERFTSYSYGLCMVYRRLGDREQAFQYCQAALLSGCKCGATKSEALKEMGLMMIERGDSVRASEYLNEALTLVRTLGLPNLEGEVLGKLGQIALRQRELPAARRHFNQALALFERHGGGFRQANAWMLLGETHLEAGELEQARKFYAQAAAFNQAVGLPSPYIALGMAKIFRAQNRLPEALAEANAAVEMIETSRATIFSPVLRASWFAGAQNIYQFHQDLLMQMHREQPAAGYAEKAFSINERGRARSLLDSLGEARANIREGVEQELLARERDLQKRVNQRAQNLTGKDSAQLASEKRQLEELLNDYQVVQSQIRAHSPRYAALTQPQPLTLAEIQQQVLDDDTLLLEYALGEPRSYLWVVGRSNWQVSELPARAEIESAAVRFYDLLKAGNKPELRGQVKLAAAKLSRLVLPPAAGPLGNKRLLIVADGVLQYIPFSVLPEPSRAEQPLLVSHEIVHSPSASLLALLRREFTGRAPASRAVLALADPVLSEDDVRLRRVKPVNQANGSLVSAAGESRRLASELTRSTRETELKLARLKFTRAEAEYIAGLARGQQGVALLDFAANKNRVFSPDIDQYRIVHFATHGLLNSRHPELSGIVLSLVDEQGRSQDGFLRLHDIYNLKLNAELVVLSACRTALGREVKGEGLLGLTRGFMYAGAPRVVASLWDVRDEATAELMKRFYQNLLTGRLPPATALRAAQLSLLREPRWAAPFYWAGFVLQGEWR